MNIETLRHWDSDIESCGYWKKDIEKNGYDERRTMKSMVIESKYDLFNDHEKQSTWDIENDSINDCRNEIWITNKMITGNGHRYI